MDNRILRILVVGNLPPHVLGGAENQVARLVEAWIGAGHSVEVAGHRIPDGVQQVCTADVLCHHIRTFTDLGRGMRAASYFLSLFRLAWRMRRRIDVVYCRGMSDGALSLVLLKALRVLPWPIVVCPINARGRGDAYFIRSIPGWRIWARMIDRHCDAINVIACAIVDDLQAIGVFRPHISRIPNGITVHPMTQRGQVAPARRLCWTGRLCAQKGLDLLLPALAAMSGKGYAFRLDLIGDGPDRPALAAQARTLGLGDRVRFLGALNADRVRAELLDADVFVLPSRYEGMSNSALEAMEAALPVLCTACGGIDEYVADGAGWVCPPNSVHALIEVLAAMFHTADKQLLAMGSRARELAESRFALPLVASSNLALLRFVVTAKQGS